MNTPQDDNMMNTTQTAQPAPPPRSKPRRRRPKKSKALGNVQTSQASPVHETYQSLYSWLDDRSDLEYPDAGDPGEVPGQESSEQVVGTQSQSPTEISPPDTLALIVDTLTDDHDGDSMILQKRPAHTLWEASQVVTPSEERQGVTWVYKDTTRLMSGLRMARKEARRTPPSSRQFTSFFESFPREIRDAIYFHVLRPDCGLGSRKGCMASHWCARTHRNCTNVLVLCRNAYEEASLVLRTHEPLLSITATKTRLFRDMRDHGLPGMSNSSRSRCRIPPRFCELQFVRLRRVAVSIAIPHPPNVCQQASVKTFQQEYSKIKAQILQLIAAVTKCDNLRCLRIMIANHCQVEYYGHPVSWRWEEFFPHDVERKMQAIIRPLIDMAVLKGVAIVAEENRLYKSAAADDKPAHYSEENECSLVAWINAIVPREARGELNFPYHMSTWFKQLVDCSGLMLMQPYDPRSMEDYPEVFVDEEIRRFTEAMKHISDEITEYKLVPECRYIRCNALFEEMAGLEKHLDDHPDHRTSYVHKAGNRIYRKACFGGRFKCWTCAEDFHKEKWLREHLDKSGHRRNGIVPRWRQDNKWYDRREAGWMERHPK